MPLIRGGITVISLEQHYQSLVSTNEYESKIAEINSSNKYFILRYTSISRCVQYFKRMRSYENVFLILHCNTTGDINVTRFNKYYQIRSIFVVANEKIVGYDHVWVDQTKHVHIFYDYQSLFEKLDHLMSDTQESDDSLFAIFNERERALRNVRQELGPFVWSQSYKGQSLFSKISYKSLLGKVSN